MSLGVHFALSARDATRILKFKDPDELVDFISEDLEERYFESEKWVFESDKGWDAIHRCLTDGQLSYTNGTSPLAWAILGGQRLGTGEDYTACLVSAEQVVEVSTALANITREWMNQRYNALSNTDYDGPIGDDDFEYTWSNFDGLRTFFQKAAKAGRPVLFTTDS